MFTTSVVIRLRGGPHLALITGHRTTVSALEHALLFPVSDSQPDALQSGQSGHAEVLVPGAGHGQVGTDRRAVFLGLAVLDGAVQAGVAAAGAGDETQGAAAAPVSVNLPEWRHTR